MARSLPALVIVFCLMATPALAGKYDDDPGHPYLTLSGGISKIFSADLYDSTPDPIDPITLLPIPGVIPHNHRVTTEYGYDGMVAVGLAYKAGRVEISGGYNFLDIEEQKVDGAAATTATGEITAYSILVNAYFEGNSDGFLSPYFGGGVGGARVAVDSPDMPGAKNGTGFAYHVGAGFNVNLGNHLSLDLGYHLLGVTNVSLGATYDADTILFHNANAGLRFIF